MAGDLYSAALGATIPPYWMSRGQATVPGYLQLSSDYGSRTIRGDAYDGSGGGNVTQAFPSADPFEACAEFTGLLSAARVRLDVGAGFGAYSAGAVGPVKTTQTVMQIGAQAWDTRYNACAVLLAIKVALAARTLAQMREAY